MGASYQVFGRSNMADQWYFASDNKRIGPFSAEQLKKLAAEGSLLPTDTVWKEGIEKGVVATKVKHLFPEPKIHVFPAIAHPRPETPFPLAEGADLQPKEAAFSNHNELSPQREATPTGKATLIKGAVLISQDGKKVVYKKRCSRCGTKDRFPTTLPLKEGVYRGRFFCPQCRRTGPVEIRVFPL